MMRNNNNIQVAVLALQLVLEARSAHFVIAHFNYFVLWSRTSLAPTQHIYLMTNLSVNIAVIAMGTVVPMSKVDGSWICYQVYVSQQLPTMLM